MTRLQRPERIPTPLRERTRAPMLIAPAYEPTRFYALRIFRFVLGVMWFWWQSSFALMFSGSASTHKRASHNRAFLESMGGLWIKVGQFVAMRRDIFRKETCDELAKLQDHADGFPWADARAVLEAELGGPIEHTFSEFSETPVAAASIGQTHEARLRHSGLRVAVKIQRPLARERFARDIRYVRFAASLFQRFGIAPQLRWDDMVWELEKALSEELDYRLEAASIHRMRKILRAHKIYVPKVFLAHSSRRVLVMEFVDGVFMSDYIHTATNDPARLERWHEENNVDPALVGERLLASRNRQVFEDNCYHADLHPGNILLQRDSRIAFIDFGAVGSLDQSTREKYQLMMTALADGNYHKVVDIFLLLCPPLPQGDPAEMKEALVRLLRSWEARTRITNLPYHEKSLTALTGMMSETLQQYMVPANWEFLQLNRADLTLDASLIFLLPRIDYLKLLRKYHSSARARMFRKVGRDVQRTVFDVWGATKIPGLIAENAYFDGEWMRRRALGFQGKMSKVAYIIEGIFNALSLASTSLVILLLAQTMAITFHWPMPFADTALTRLLATVVPYHSPQLGIFLVIVAYYMSRRLAQIRRYVGAKDFSPPQ